MCYTNMYLDYIIYIKRWLSILLPKIVPHLYGNGGSVIMVQVSLS